MQRALLCGCGRHLEAWDEEELASKVLTHLRWEHPGKEQQQHSQVRGHVAAHSYRYECMEEVYAGGAEPDEEFGLDPY